MNLVHVANFDGENDLDIHGRTTIMHKMYSRIETTAIRIGSDTFELSAYGVYAHNGVEGADPNSMTLAGYPIVHSKSNKKDNWFDIILSPTSNITIGNHKDIVNLKFVHTFQMFKDLEISGLMGNVHGQMLARDGKTDLSDDMVAFGQEWQVRPDEEPMLFRAARAPQYPQKCVMPDMEAKEARRLGEGITEEAAKAACSQFTGASFEACVYDVTATNDLEQAENGIY